ncbi:MAG: two-component sensor histidine kinase [Ignavibacteriae bacterium HGW-Ignavibacteriae-3]|nr:MAG: two-component sensor histidine kinase [Ignavibacteriae bacterium HGW-Ignavibacteriae-3]
MIPGIVIIALVFYLFLSFDLYHFIIFLFCSLLLSSLFSFYAYRKRDRDIKQIKKVIENIRLNSFSAADKISLSNNLSELESEIKSMFLKIQNDIAQMKKLEEVRTEFLGNVSHELRTPIFAIQGFIETLLDGAIDDKEINRVFLEKANKHTINLNSLLNDLIDISMIESGQMLMSFRYFTAFEFLDEIIQEFIPRAEEKNLKLIFEPVNRHIKIYGDKQRLKQALNNLIMNAIKYTDSGSVSVGVKEEEKVCRIFVKDTGFGIPGNDIKRIFERFYRVDRDRSREMGGTGLGLAIVKHIVEAHGFNVEVKSELGNGSEFSFCLKK